MTQPRRVSVASIQLRSSLLCSIARIFFSSIACFSTGDITIASVPSLMHGRVPRILRSYATQHPNNRVEILDRTSTLVIEAVQRRQAEFGLHVPPPIQQGLHDEILVRDPFVVYCRHDLPLAGSESIAWADLAGHDLIMLGGSSGNRLLMEAQLSLSGIEVKTKFVVGYFSSAIGLASEGLGMATLGESLVENLRLISRRFRWWPRSSTGRSR